MPARHPRLSFTKFLLPKEGARADECEDAIGADTSALRFAVADGATEAFDSGSWARSLAEGWAAPAGPAPGAESLGRWAAAEGARLHEAWEGKELPWYAEEKRRAGSFAAFVGLAFEVGEDLALRFRAVALGDSCLFHLRGGELLAAVPVSRPEDFNSAPVLLPSREDLRDAAVARAVALEGEARAGDLFLLASDAAAAWFLSAWGGRPTLLERFDSLLAASENEALAALLRAERSEGRLKDDDVAVLRIVVG
ncbi:MAG TPA: hypothetical protein VD968_14915 [Pyrinomonadaceae bacterium]|nr:hypothetical protein [Pyrinomonadaceae bacterium]